MKKDASALDVPCILYDRDTEAEAKADDLVRKVGRLVSGLHNTSSLL
jgi:hypothetical protein